jgi:hypothetical protein|tara:strand:+ start:104 stop:352 length:249 start_codon:yes stop_codon:yes gene_type:complete
LDHANFSDKSAAAYCFGDMFVHRVVEWLRGIETNGIGGGPRVDRTATNSRLPSTESLYAANTNSGYNDVSKGYAMAQYRAIE